MKADGEKRPTRNTPAAWAMVVTVALGWLFLELPIGLPLVHGSYDLLQPFLSPSIYPSPVIVHLDQQALQDYHLQPGQPWPRSVHARLLDRLTRDQARLVVFDVTLTQAGDVAADRELAAAMRRHGRVVLAGDRVPIPGIALGYTVVPPLPLFETNAAAWGTAKIYLDPDRVGRRYDSGDDQEPGLDWAAAAAIGATPTRQPERRVNEVRWLNYYGSPRPFARSAMSYTNAETKELGFFTGKVVFIGGKPETLLRGEESDSFGSPFTRWNSTFVPGVELCALAFTNLVQEDWLRRSSKLSELAVLTIAGCLLALGFQAARTQRVAAWAGLMLLIVTSASVLTVWSFRVWFPWAIVAFIQLPTAVLCRFWWKLPSAVPGNEDRAVAQPVRSPDSPKAESPDPGHGSLNIPDHQLIRCIGEGAYGQVWIARNAVGLYHAVKVVYRSRFGTDDPYERAFRGIQKFMPISRSHEGFVHILHVGRNDAVGAFFYIMEAGDDQTKGQQFDPVSYQPRTLASELTQRGALPPTECLELMLALTAAVDRLHQHQLVHRDIKPANLIFVNRHPKLADIDLVTDLSVLGGASRIGTEGYLAPEGPGTAAADVFSLGRVLYVALTGKQPEQMPELPTRVMSQANSGLVLELNRVACKACERELSRRYPTVSALRHELSEIARRDLC